MIVVGHVMEDNKIISVRVICVGRKLITTIKYYKATTSKLISQLITLRSEWARLRVCR